MGDASAGADPVVQRLRAAGCVWAQDEARLLRQAARGDPVALDRLVSRRIRGEPLEHVLGWADFAGRRVPVRRGVFVPRARTELLVRAATGLVAPGDWVVDLCCGSAAVGLAVVTRVAVRLVAADIDVRAVAASRAALAQVARSGGGPPVVPADAEQAVRPPLVRRGDLFQALPRHLRGRVGQPRWRRRWTVTACPPGCWTTRTWTPPRCSARSAPSPPGRRQRSLSSPPDGRPW